MNRLEKILKTVAMIGLAGYLIFSIFSPLLNRGLDKYGVQVDWIAGVCWFLFSAAVFFKILIMILKEYKKGSRGKTVFKIIAWSSFGGFILFSGLSMVSAGFFYKYHSYYDAITVGCLIFCSISLVCSGIIKLIETGKSPGR